MKFLDDHYPKYFKDDTQLLFRFTYGLGDSVFLKHNKQSTLNHNDERPYYVNEG